MKSICLENIADIVDGNHQLTPTQAKTIIESICTDTRQIKEGALFVALRGDNFDGNKFVKKAFELGASAVICHEGFALAETASITVPDTLQALGDLAQYQRQQLTCPFISVTGSSGKTSVKELIGHLLATQGQALKNEANFNNRIGVPLTLLQGYDAPDYAVIEAGMSEPGEISRLAEIIGPNIGLITNIGGSHTANFSDFDALITEKMALVQALPVDGLAILPGDFDYSEKIKSMALCPVISVGLNACCDVSATNVTYDEQGHVSFICHGLKEIESLRVKTALHGEHSIRNVLMALVAIRECAVCLPDILDAVATFSGHPMRFEVIKHGGYTLINDAYNSNPVSACAAIAAFEHMPVTGKKCIVLGSMLELGDQAVSAHEQVLAYVLKTSMEIVVFGEYFLACADHLLSAKKVTCLPEGDQLCDHLRATTKPGDGILFKASRGVALEKQLKQFIESIDKLAVCNKE